MTIETSDVCVREHDWVSVNKERKSKREIATLRETCASRRLGEYASRRVREMFVSDNQISYVHPNTALEILESSDF